MRYRALICNMEILVCLFILIMCRGEKKNLLRLALNGPSLTLWILLGLGCDMEGIISKHFGIEIIDELFDRFCKKEEDFISMLESKYNGDQLFIF